MKVSDGRIREKITARLSHLHGHVFQDQPASFLSSGRLRNTCPHVLNGRYHHTVVTVRTDMAPTHPPSIYTPCHSGRVGVGGT